VKRAASLIALGVGLLVVSAACTLLDQPAQCSTDADCIKFDAVCNTSTTLCVPKGNGATGDNDAGDLNPGQTTADDSGAPPIDAKCTVSPKPTANPSMGLPPGPDGGAQVAALTLDCDKDWILEGPLVVPSGSTLTIKAGTTIRAKKATGAAIVVQPGGRIVAEGQKNAPIVMTVDDVAAAPKAGDWRGLFVLGKAPRSGTAPYNGDSLLAYGGNNGNDDSGVLSFVRIEYARDGLVFGGVGKQTKVDSIQVRMSNDNCFVLNGGSFDAKHLVCQAPADEQFEIGDGYTGRLQFVFGQKTALGDGHNGLLFDGAATAPVVYNATICGQAQAQTITGTGVVVRNGTKTEANDALIVGWAAAIDAIGTVNAPLLRASIAFGNTANPAALEEGAANDDNAFDEIAFFRNADNANTEDNPGLVDCHDAKAPKPWPAAGALTTGARTPPNDGFFDTTASFIGAFKDGSDAWMTGTWVRFDDK
jgi:hypothetical protein